MEGEGGMGEGHDGRRGWDGVEGEGGVRWKERVGCGGRRGWDGVEGEGGVGVGYVKKDMGHF